MRLQTIQRLLVAVIFIVGTGVSGMANSIEEPPFDLLDRIGDVEIRQYYPAVQAITQLNGSAQTSAGFRRLAGYIFGGNADGESISMTHNRPSDLEPTTSLMIIPSFSLFRRDRFNKFF